MWITANRLRAGHTVDTYGTLVEDPRPLMVDGLVELDFGHDGAVVLSLDCELNVIAL